MPENTSASRLPGADLIERGVRDLGEDVVSIESLLVSIGAPRLIRLGVPLRTPLPAAESRLYDLLAARYGDAAHSRYNALVRLLVSYERAAVAAGSTHA